MPLPEPKFGLERLARAVFAYHTVGVVYPEQRSGAEWWVQIREVRGDEDTKDAGDAGYADGAEELVEDAELADDREDRIGFVEVKVLALLPQKQA